MPPLGRYDMALEVIDGLLPSAAHASAVIH
jgi:hypothetical protein